VPKPSELLDLWYTALAEPYGIYITTPNPALTKSLFYQARLRHRRDGDTSLDHLQIRTAPNDPAHTLWIINPTPNEDTP